MQVKRGISKIILIFSVFCLIGSNLPNVVAHSPDYVQLNYDSSTNNLEVTISHSVDNPLSHYIERVKIFINDSQTALQTHNYTNQPSEPVFTYFYDLTAANDTKIEVIANCNVNGVSVGSLVVGAVGGPSIPLDIKFVIPFVFLGVIVIFFYVRRKVAV